MSTPVPPETLKVYEEVGQGGNPSAPSAMAPSSCTLSTSTSEQRVESVETLQSATEEGCGHLTETPTDTEKADSTPNEVEKRQEPIKSPLATTETTHVEHAISKIAHTLENINDGIQQITSLFKEIRDNEANSSGSDSGSESVTPSQPVASDQPLVAELESVEKTRMPTVKNWRNMPLITEINKCNYRQFKEHRRAEPRYVVDAFLADSKAQDEMSSWNTRFHNPSTFSPVLEPNDENENEESQSNGTEQKWIHRIRINSTFVMKILYDFGSCDVQLVKPLANEAHTFLRPFGFLLQYQQAMRETLENLSDGHRDLATETFEECGGKDPDKRCQLLAELRCYVDFVDQYLMPDLNRFRHLKQPFDENESIRLEDVWYLFYPGQLVFIQKPETPEANPSRSTSVFQNIARVRGVNHPTHRAGWGHLWNEVDPDCDNCKWSINCYNIDFNGDEFGCKTRVVHHLKGWEGEKRILDLEIVPLSCLKDSEQVLNRAIQDGKALVNLNTRRFGFYSGWTLTEGPFGESLLDVEKETITASSHIESDVLVDYHESFNVYPWWKPVFRRPDGMSGSTMRYLPGVFVEWVGPEDTIRVVDAPDRLVISDCATFIQWEEYRNKDPILNSSQSSLSTPEDYAILLRRFFAYSVWERKFVQLDIKFLDRREQQESDKAFNSLQIDESHKKLINALVQSHFKKKESERKVKIEMETQDLIRGKGKGVIMLLHGAPGVGKTATAEAIAQKWNKPLFPITCGDLGVDAETVEGSLNGIFRLAHLWDCILLLDEADVFITQRERRDLGRNALVSGEFNS